MARQVKVVQQEENPIPVEIMGQAIVDIGTAMKRISSSRLNRKCLVVLLAHSTDLPMSKVEYVLNALDQLEATYLKQR